MREDERERVERQCTEAWRRLKKDKNYSDWIKVGEGLQVGREWAMHQAGTNQPKGKAYNTAFGEWMQRRKVDDMDKGDRARLFELMDNIPAIEAWRKTLTLTERLKLNHPNAVLRKWKAYMRPEPRPEPGAEPKPTLKDSVVLLSEENARLKAHIAELEAAREGETAPTPPSPGPITKCSFCGREGDPTQDYCDLHVGEFSPPRAAICSDCARIAHEIFVDTADDTPPTKPRKAKAKAKGKAKAKDKAKDTAPKAGPLRWTDSGKSAASIAGHNIHTAPARVGTYCIVPTYDGSDLETLHGYEVEHRRKDDTRNLGSAPTLEQAKRIAEADHAKRT